MPLKCKIESCAFAIDWDGKIDTPEKIQSYKQFLYHVQGHLINELEDGNPVFEDTSPYLEQITSFESVSMSQWNVDMSTATVSYPSTCSWRCGNDDEVSTATCGYQYQAFDDYLVHNYYHAHVERLHAVSDDFPKCQWQWMRTADIYSQQECKLSCQWMHGDNEECGYVCLVPDLLQLHVNAESEFESESPGPTACRWKQQCNHQVKAGKGYLKRLQNHAATHLGVKQQVCKSCNQQFTCRASLRRHHERQIQRGNRRHNYKCVGCERSFVDMATLSSHRLYVHGSKRGYGPCRFCNKTFKSLSDYKRHEKNVHKSEREQHQCDQPRCHFIADTKAKINHHRRTVHKGEKGYKCHYCDSVFTRGFKLSKHFRKEHRSRDKRFTNKENGRFVKLVYTAVQSNGYKMLAEDQNASLDELKTVDFSRQTVVLDKDGTEKMLYNCQYCQKVYQQYERHEQHGARCGLNPNPAFLQTVQTDHTDNDQLVPLQYDFEPDEPEEDKSHMVPVSSELIDDGDKQFIRINFDDETQTLYQVVSNGD